MTKNQAAALVASARTGSRLLVYEPGALHCGPELIEPFTPADLEHLESLGFLRLLPNQRRAYAVTEAGALWGARKLVDELAAEEAEE